MTDTRQVTWLATCLRSCWSLPCSGISLRKGSCEWSAHSERVSEPLVLSSGYFCSGSSTRAPQNDRTGKATIGRGDVACAVTGHQYDGMTRCPCDAQCRDRSSFPAAAPRGGDPTGSLGRQDSNLCIPEPKFAKTLSPAAGFELSHGISS